jgi:serine/threonine-protein kinase
MLLVSGAVVIAGAVVGGVLLLGPNSGSGSGTDPTNPSTTDPGPPPPDPGDQLLAVLPGDFDASSCSSGQLAGDGDVAALSCGQAFTQPGPTAATFRLYPSGTVDGVFLNDMSQNGIPALGPGQVCPDFLGYGGYTVDGGVRGRAACFIGPDNTSYVAWTDDGEGTEGVATIANGGGAGVYTLWNWWADPGRAAFGP